MRKDSLAGLLITALLLCASAPADAHVGAAPEALDVFVAGDGGDAIAIEASYGLLLSDGGPQYQWLCHEAVIEIGATITPRYAMNSQGVILATTGVLGSSRDTHETVYRTTDRCNWLTTSGLTDEVVTDLAFSPTQANRAIASTSTLAFGSTNALYYSDDAGATWQASDTSSEERLFRNVHFGEDGTAWATASWFNPLGSWLYRSDDAGLTWHETEVTFEAKGSRQVLLDVLVATGDGPQVWLRVDAPITDRLLHSTDGGVTFSETLQVNTEMKTGARTSDGSNWLVDGFGQLHKAAPGEDFAPLKEGPSSSGAAADARGLFVSTRIWNEEFALLHTTDSESFEGLFSLIDTGPPPTCDAGSHSVLRCEPYWEALLASLSPGDDDDSAGDDDDDDSGDDDSGDDDDDSAPPAGTGCCADEDPELPALAVLLVVALTGSLRRRVSLRS